MKTTRKPCCTICGSTIRISSGVCLKCSQRIAAKLTRSEIRVLREIAFSGELNGRTVKQTFSDAYRALEMLNAAGVKSIETQTYRYNLPDEKDYALFTAKHPWSFHKFFYGR